MVLRGSGNTKMTAGKGYLHSLRCRRRRSSFLNKQSPVYDDGSNSLLLSMSYFFKLALTENF